MSINHCAQRVQTALLTRNDIKNSVEDFYEIITRNLIVGIKTNNISLVQEAYYHDALPRLLDIDKNIISPLMLAVRHGHTDIVHFLIAVGADINHKDRNGNTALQIACDKKRTDIVKLLLDSGAQTNIENNSRSTPLLSAVTQGSLEIVTLLVSSGANVNASDKDGLSLCMVAAQRGYTNVIEYLVDHNAHINSQDKTGNTALMHALESGYLSTVQSLIITCDADCTVPNNNNQTVLSIAQKRGFITILNTIIYASNSLGQTALHHAVLHGRINTARLLIKLGANVNSSDKEGYTPLMFACYKKHKDIVQELITKKAQVCISNLHDETPLFLSLGLGDISQLLLSYYETFDLDDHDNMLSFLCTAYGNNYRLLHLMFVKLPTSAQKELFIKCLQEIFDTHADQEKLIATICTDTLNMSLIPSKPISLSTAQIFESSVNENNSYFSTLTHIVERFMNILLSCMSPYYRNANTMSFDRISRFVGLVLVSSGAYVMYKKLLHTRLPSSLM